VSNHNGDLLAPLCPDQAILRLSRPMAPLGSTYGHSKSRRVPAGQDCGRSLAVSWPWLVHHAGPPSGSQRAF